LLIGAIQSIAWLIFQKTGWPKEAIAVLSISIGLLITGGLHIDGLMDTADGLAAGKKKCLQAMVDSRVGASGVQALIVILAIQYAALLKLDYLAPIAFPIVTFWGRFSSLWAIANFPYLHSNRNSYFHTKYWKGFWRESIPSLLFILLFFIFLLLFSPTLYRTLNLISFSLLGIVPAIVIPNVLGNHLGGHSGDTYGASLVLVETIILFILSMNL